MLTSCVESLHKIFEMHLKSLTYLDPVIFRTSSKELLLLIDCSNFLAFLEGKCFVLSVDLFRYCFLVFWTSKDYLSSGFSKMESSS